MSAARRSASPLRLSLPASPGAGSSRSRSTLRLPPLTSPAANVPLPPASPLLSPFLSSASQRGPSSPLARSTTPTSSYFPTTPSPSQRWAANQPRCPTLRPIARLENQDSPASLFTVEDVSGEGFPWDGGGGAPGSSLAIGSPLVAHQPRHIQRASSSWSHHEHSGGTPSLSPSSPPSTTASPSVPLNPPTPPASAHSHAPQRLNRHQTLRLARQTVQVQTTVQPPPASYFDIDPDLTALSSQAHRKMAQRRAGASGAGGGGLRPLTSVKAVVGGEECPLRRIMGQPTPPVAW